MTSAPAEAEVVLSCGRKWLVVCGVYVAMEGDLCRDPDFSGRAWSGDTLKEAANRINAALAEQLKAATYAVNALVAKAGGSVELGDNEILMQPYATVEVLRNMPSLTTTFKLVRDEQLAAMQRRVEAEKELRQAIHEWLPVDTKMAMASSKEIADARRR